MFKNDLPFLINNIYLVYNMITYYYNTNKYVNKRKGKQSKYFLPVLFKFSNKRFENLNLLL